MLFLMPALPNLQPITGVSPPKITEAAINKVAFEVRSWLNFQSRTKPASDAGKCIRYLKSDMNITGKSLTDIIIQYCVGFRKSTRRKSQPDRLDDFETWHPRPKNNLLADLATNSTCDVSRSSAEQEDTVDQPAPADLTTDIE